MVPDLVTAATKDDGSVDLDLWKAVQTALIIHCEQNGNRMAVLDAPPGMTPQQIKDWRSRRRHVRLGVRRALLPVDQGGEPDRRQRRRRGLHPAVAATSPASGRAPTTTRGVWKAPANDTIRGCLDVERDDHPERAGPAQPDRHQLHPPVRHPRHPRSGAPAPWPSDTDWRYINVRRLFNMVETTIIEGTQWAVFEPNDVTLWEGVKRTLNAFLRGPVDVPARCSAHSADQAFYVKCDAETNPPESIDQGKLVVEVGIAPVKPAEFVVFRIAQHKQIAG